jgi:AcrR family transcriptional regulator
MTDRGTRRRPGNPAGKARKPRKAAALDAPARSAKRGAGRPKASAGRIKKRSKGRPYDPDRAVGRDALVKATRELLRTMPPAKMTRLDIARHAGVDPALIRYYFGDKSQLLGEVVLEVLREMRTTREKRASTAGTADRLRSRLADSVRLFQEHPHHYSLVLEQIFSGVEPKLRAMWRRDVVQAGVVELTSIIEDGVKKGELRRVDPRFLHLLIVAAGEFYATGRAVLEDLFGPQAIDAKLERDYVHFLFDLFMHGMAKR